jgi:hypothetical protein
MMGTVPGEQGEQVERISALCAIVYIGHLKNNLSCPFSQEQLNINCDINVGLGYILGNFFDKPTGNTARALKADQIMSCKFCFHQTGANEPSTFSQLSNRMTRVTG